MTSGPDAGKSTLGLAIQQGEIESKLLLRVAPDPAKTEKVDAESQASEQGKAFSD